MEKDGRNGGDGEEEERMKKRRRRRRIEGNRCHGPREEPRATQFAFLYNSSLMSSLNHVDDVQQRCRATPCAPAAAADDGLDVATPSAGRYLA